MALVATLWLAAWLCPVPAVAEPVDSLLAAVDSTATRQRTLQAELADVRARIGRLAREVDSLKQASGGGQASGRLREALAEAVTRVARDEAISQDLIRTARRLNRLRDQAREAVDRDLAAAASRLAGDLTEAQRADAVSRLQGLRQALADLQGHATESSESAVQESVTLYDADGPDEIRQKADLVWDMADQVGREAGAARRQLEALRMEERLRRRLATFSGEVGMFDENLPVVRSASPERRAADGGEGLLAGADAGDRTEEAVAGPGGEVTAAVGPDAAGKPGYAAAEPHDAEGLAAEIATVQARIRALAEQEDALRARAESFKKALRDMLENAP